MEALSEEFSSEIAKRDSGGAMNHISKTRHDGFEAAILTNPAGASPFLLVCEHASNNIPARYSDLGLTKEAIQSHAAWDPGAMAVAQIMAKILDARLVSSTVSRLVYDCNRPPESDTAIREISEIYQIPANVGLSDAEKSKRAEDIYLPFRQLLSDTIAALDAPVIVTIHSFTPVYNGHARSVELGILHDTDSRLADAILEISDRESEMRIERNTPYSPVDRVTHNPAKPRITRRISERYVGNP